MCDDGGGYEVAVAEETAAPVEEWRARLVAQLELLREAVLALPKGVRPVIETGTQYGPQMHIEGADVSLVATRLGATVQHRINHATGHCHVDFVHDGIEYVGILK